MEVRKAREGCRQEAMTTVNVRIGKIGAIIVLCIDYIGRLRINSIRSDCQW